jgi:GT2 family glycosyltransferase
MSPTAAPQITIVIVDYNRHADTVACLASLRASDLADRPILVVDNGSEPPLQALPEPGAIEILRLERNLGFAAGFNLGIRRALAGGAEAVFVLNNDTVVAPDLGGPLIAGLAAGVGIVAPRIYYAADPQRIWSDGFDANPLTLEIRRGRRGQLEDANAPTRSVDYVAGCAMLIQRRVLETIGLFDERFFAYYEDLDYCIRARAAGFRIVTIPAAHVWHKVASSTGLQSPRRAYLMAYGSVRFYAKHAGWRWPVMAPARAGSLAKTLLSLAGHKRRDLIAAHLNGIRDGLRDTFGKQKNA